MARHLGEFEQLVLLALIRLGDEAYGVAVHQEIAKRTGRDVSFASVYTTLARLQEKGLVRSTLGEATPERGGRKKKYFAILPEGRRVLRVSLQALRTMARDLGASLEMP